MERMQRPAVPAGDVWEDQSVKAFSGSPFERIGRDWMLVTGGTGADWNTMTASWGGLGILWDRDVAFVFVRPTRHTFSFLENNAAFSLSFFDQTHKKALAYCGAHSGKDTDKAAGAGLTPIVFGDGTISFAEASEILTCRTLYSQDIDPRRFKDATLDIHYPNKDYHRLYIAELVSLRSRRR